MSAAPASMPTGRPSTRSPIVNCSMPKKLNPPQPNGAKPVRPSGATLWVQLAELTKNTPTTMTNSTAATLMNTIRALNPADSLMPFTRMAVMITTMMTAGRLTYDPVKVTQFAGSPHAAEWFHSSGALPSDSGNVRLIFGNAT